MISRLRLIPRIALFAALIYVLNWSTSYLPNGSLMFFVIFSAGFLWGYGAGMTVGAIGMWLWTTFNPFGPADLAIALVQVIGASLSGLVGASFRSILLKYETQVVRTVYLVVAALLCVILFFIPVNVVDAWLYQPFWPRLVTGLFWSLIALGANVLIFPLLFPITKMLYERECARSSQL